ncbi:MAG: hypothetical protein AB7I41_19335 [Candidatus Sericytochromatia bacterium]
MVQAVGGSSSYYGYAPVQRSASVTTVPSSTVNPYLADSYTGGSDYSPMSMAAQGGIGAIVGDSAAASRLSAFLINTPDRLLKVGAGLGVVGRFFVNVLSGSVPMFTSSAQQAQIKQNVFGWISSADLMRTGASPNQTRMMQDVGLWNVQNLTLYTNPADQAVLAQRLAGAAAARGLMMEAPNQGMVSAWVNAAIGLPKYNF